MTEIALSAMAGLALGLFFFGGLYLTVVRAMTAKIPALWFSASLLLRTGILLYGFYAVAGADWRRLIACVAGFYAARIAITRLTRHKELPCT